jgi:hypothetical protein
MASFLILFNFLLFFDFRFLYSIRRGNKMMNLKSEVQTLEMSNGKECAGCGKTIRER